MAADEPWRDASQPPGQRADELLAAMTFDQKVQLALGNFAPVAQFGVPALPSDDGPSGIRAPGTTSFPSSQTLASTFDRGLARAYGEAIGTEARGKAFNWWLGPAMDIARTPLSGRQPENLGEDPFLAGETVAEEVAEPERARDRDAQALRGQQPGVRAHRSSTCPTTRAAAAPTRSSPSARCGRSTRRRSSAPSANRTPTRSCARTTASTSPRRARTRRCFAT
jgi:Glycosyl hydrolase family 3 N terminal domain